MPISVKKEIKISDPLAIYEQKEMSVQVYRIYGQVRAF